MAKGGCAGTATGSGTADLLQATERRDTAADRSPEGSVGDAVAVTNDHWGFLLQVEGGCQSQDHRAMKLKINVDFKIFRAGNFQQNPLKAHEFSIL